MQFRTHSVQQPALLSQPPAAVNAALPLPYLGSAEIGLRLRTDHGQPGVRHESGIVANIGAIHRHPDVGPYAQVVDQADRA